MRDGGVRRMLLIGGDVERPAGPFAGALDVLETGATVDHGIESIGVAGYPENHPRVASAELWEALARKQEFAERTGTRVHIVTQFGFDPSAVTAWAREVHRRGITLPIHAGIAGPVPLPRLIKYAIHCGVGASLKALMRNTASLASLAAAGAGATAATPDRMLLGVLRGREELQAFNIVQPHFFSLGGALETARWLRALRAGAFEVDAGGTGLTARDIP
jgi:methylenetetrahydrofolate reductase (NADPH)